MSPARNVAGDHSEVYDLSIRCATVPVDCNEGRAGEADARVGDHA